MVVVVVLGSALEAWGGWWVRGWGKRLEAEARERRVDRGRVRGVEEELELGKERFCDEV